MANNELVLPVLVTRGLILFPNIPSQIDASRPISVKAIEKAKEETDGVLIVVSQKRPEVDNPTIDDIFMMGTLCRITSVTNQKGFIRIKVTPITRFLLKQLSYDENSTIMVAVGEECLDLPGDSKVEAGLVRAIIQTFEKFQDISLNIPKNVINQLSKGVSASELADALGNYLPMSIENKQRILETLDTNERLKLAFEAVNEEREISVIDSRLQEEVRRQAEKNQKEYFLREKLKAIKSELGEDVDGDSSEDKILEKLEKEPYPDFVKAKVKNELKRYAMMPQASLEAALIKSYIETIMQVPWFQATVDSDDLSNVQKILDEDHYGLDQVKKRIVEYLAVKKMTNSLKAPILCFYGPPGVGKTSLGKSIARALGRKFFKVSLGGISDEAEIRGHRRTYVGSMPGRIINGMRKSTVINPVFLLDEIDKVASSYKGDPASALLEVLDPEQNFAFNDNYLEEPYDLSNVLFIATANNIENVPAPLRDRLELIEVNSYTEIEKTHIAERHLVPKQITLCGLDASQIIFNKTALIYIIQFYTREAGVRDLERKLGAICRKAVVEILSSPENSTVNITVDKVKEYLGIEKFDDFIKEKLDQIGVVTGLAYTEFGGSTLPIEVNYFKGKGTLILTGNLGNVMKESAAIALDYVRSNAEKYLIEPELFEKNDVHIHVPEGAVPKDGPSAGVAITTAIISCLTNRLVSAKVAMTGEVTLRGNALAIGGLREKSLAALRNGIKTIIIPKENEKMVAELPKEVRENLDIIFMNNVDDALKVALL